MYKYLILLLLGTIISLQSCSDDEDLPINAAFSVEPSFVVELGQTLPAPGRFEINFKNKDAFKCSNIEMNSTLTVTDNQLLVDLSDISLNGDCIEGELYLDNLFEVPTHHENYDLTINLNKGISHMGAVAIFDDFMEIKLQSSERLDLAELRINKIPAQISWGYLNKTVDQSIDIKDEFLMSTITSSPNDPRNIFLPLGNYSHFVVDGDSQLVSIDGRADFGQAVILDMSTDGNWKILQELLNKAKSQYPNLEFKFYNSNGLTIE